MSPTQLRASAAEHPRIARHGALISASREQVREAAARRFPNFTLGVEIIETGHAANLQTPDSGKDPVLISVAISLPLWWGRYRDAEEAAMAQAQAHAADREAAIRTAEAELESSPTVSLFCPNGPRLGCIMKLFQVDANIMALAGIAIAVGTMVDVGIVFVENISQHLSRADRTEDDGSRVRQWRDHIRSPKDIWNEIRTVAQRPGLTDAPLLMPIKARMVMLQSGMRAPLGIKVQGPSLEAIEAWGLQLESLLSSAAVLRSETVFADRVVGKPYIEIDIDREAVGRYGLSIVEVQRWLQMALGGATLTYTVEGRERYPVRVRSEDTFLTSYVLFDKDPSVSEVEAIEHVKAAIDSALERGSIHLPAGVSYTFAGTLENQLRTATTLLALLPVITSQGRGSEIMVAMALPVAGGMALELITLFIVPVLYCAVEEHALRRSRPQKS